MFETVFTLLTVCFLARMSPGPDMMLLIRHSSRGTQIGDNGIFNVPYSAFGCVLGVCTGLVFHVSLSVLGLAFLLKSNPVLFNALRYAGAFYLLYIGYRCFTDDGAMDLSTGECSVSGSSFGQGFKEGLLCNLLNPKVTLFILSVFMQIIGSDATFGDKLIFGGVIIGEALLGWSTFVIFLNTRFMQNLYGKHVALVNKITGVILFLLGGAVFVS